MTETLWHALHRALEERRHFSYVEVQVIEDLLKRFEPNSPQVKPGELRDVSGGK